MKICRRIGRSQLRNVPRQAAESVDRDERGLVAVGAERLEIRRFLAVVELGHERTAELGDHVDETEPPPGFGVGVGEFGDALDRVHVVDDLHPNVRALNLDHDRPAVAQLGAVNLPE